MIKSIVAWLLCATDNHDWTSAVEQEIPATATQLNDGIRGFWDYAKMYCKRCNEIHPLSKDKLRY